MYDTILKRLEEISDILSGKKFEIGNKYKIGGYLAEVVDREDVSIIKIDMDLKTVVVPQYCQITRPNGVETEVIYYNGEFIKADETI